MKASTIEFLQEHKKHWFTIKYAQTISNLEMSVKEEFEKLVIDEVDPRYKACLWCPESAYEMVNLIYREYEKKHGEVDFTGEDYAHKMVTTRQGTTVEQWTPGTPPLTDTEELKENKETDSDKQDPPKTDDQTNNSDDPPPPSSEQNDPPVHITQELINQVSKGTTLIQSSTVADPEKDKQTTNPPTSTTTTNKRGGRRGKSRNS